MPFVCPNPIYQPHPPDKTKNLHHTSILGNLFWRLNYFRMLLRIDVVPCLTCTSLILHHVDSANCWDFKAKINTNRVDLRVTAMAGRNATLACPTKNHKTHRVRLTPGRIWLSGDSQIDFFTYYFEVAIGNYLLSPERGSKQELYSTYHM